MILFLKRLRKSFSSLIEKKAANEQVLRAVLIAICLNIFFGLLFYIVEHKAQETLTFADSVWWSMVTMTTVGYGDHYAKTFAGRFLISYPCMLIGIGIIGYLVGIAADSVLERSSLRKKGLMDIQDKNHVIICTFSGIDKILNIITELRACPQYKNSEIILITDVFEELPNSLKSIGIKFVKGSPTNEDVLLRSNIIESAGVFILAKNSTSSSSDEKSFAVASIIEIIEKEHDVKIKTIVELASKDNKKLIQRSNVDGIVSTYGITGRLLVQEFLNIGVNEVVQQLLSNTIGSQFYIFDTKLDGRKISDIQIAILKHPENLQLIGIIKNGKNILNPPKTLTISKEDKLIVLAEDRKDFEMIENDILKNT